MKLSMVSALFAGAGLVQVAAVPIRLVIISKTSEGFPAVPDNVATLNLGEGKQFDHHGMPEKKVKHHGGCAGRMGRFRQKGIEISNAFRQALGMPLIEVSHPNPGDGPVHILPFMPLSPEMQIGSSSSSRVSDLPHPHPHHAPPPNVPGPHNHHRPHHHIHGGHKSSFTNRLHYSLMNLGRWEGRAVAFVLGCGIGVLLRMFWVLAIVLYRSIKGSDEPEHEYAHVTIIEEYEDEATPIHPSPPSYVYPVDEKVATAPETTVENK